jgi:multidrug efflux system membrane fusion protein
VDNQVDKATGTILLRATFANADERLWPGQFVNLVLTLTTQKNAVVIPSRAVQTSQQGQYIYLVKPDLTAEMRPVTVSRTTDILAVIVEGLAPGEKVVTDGQLRVVPGGKVEIKNNKAAAPAARP